MRNYREPPMTARRRLSPDARREELLEAAARLATEAGDVSAAALDRVAEAAGCSRNLAYRYFPNHDALVEALADRERAAVAARLLQVPSRAPFDEWFQQVTEAVFDLAEERGRLLLMLFDRSAFPKARSRRGELGQVIVGKLTHAGVPAERARVVGPILGSALMGAAGVLVNGRGARDDVATELAKVADSLVG
jgi:AcrR family transcriptional regulator